MCCSHGQCFLCIPVEKGCLVCAIVIAVGTGMSLLVGIILGSLTAAGVMFGSYIRDYQSYDSYTYKTVASSGIAVAMFMFALASAIGFIFALALCMGISKRVPMLVKAYFIYGVTVTALGALATAVVLPACGSVGALVIFAGCVIYSLFLVLVQQTYFKLVGGDNGAFKDHNPLVQAAA